MLREMGSTNGGENYSTHGWAARGWPPFALISWRFPHLDDESMTMGQIKECIAGTKLVRRCWLLRFPFAIGSLITVPFDVKNSRVMCIRLYVSATPGDWDGTETVVGKSSVRQGFLIRSPVRPTIGQMDDLLGEINARTEKASVSL